MINRDVLLPRDEETFKQLWIVQVEFYHFHSYRSMAVGIYPKS